MTDLDDMIGLLVRSPSAEQRRRKKHVHYECRNCGTTLSSTNIACTACGADEIARISLQ